MSAVSLPLITCENGMGRLTPYACGRRWKIANGEADVSAQERAQASAIRDSPCRGCEFGGARAEGVGSSKREAPVGGDSPKQRFACERCGESFMRSYSGRGRKPSICDKCKPGNAKATAETASPVAPAPRDPTYVPEPAQVLPPAAFEIAHDAEAESPPVVECATAPASPRAIVEQRVEALGRTKERACIDCNKLFKPAPGPGSPPLRCPECKAKPKTPRRKLATEVGRTETRTCDLLACGKTFTHTATRGAIPRYCTPECARQAENDARRERERLARIDQGMVPRAHLLRADVIEMERPEALAVVATTSYANDSLEAARSWLQQRAAIAAQLQQEIDAAGERIRSALEALAELTGGPRMTHRVIALSHDDMRRIDATMREDRDQDFGAWAREVLIGNCEISEYERERMAKKAERKAKKPSREAKAGT